MDDSLRSVRQIGRVVRPHGVKGELTVAPETDDPDRFEVIERVWIGADPESAMCFEILSVRNRPSRFGITTLLVLKGVESREDAERLAGQDVFASEDDLPPPEEGEFYLSDLAGMTVVSVSGDELGHVHDVLEAPGQNLLSIRRPDGSTALVPLVEEFLESVDLDEGVVVIRTIEGLL